MSIATTIPVDASASAATTRSRWFSSGFWAVADQGLFSVSNAALNIILARMLTEEQFGGFVVGFTLFLILGTVHNAFLIEPMLVFGAQNYRSWLRQYLGVLIYGHCWLATACAAVLAGAGVVCHMTGRTEIANALYSVAAAAPFILFLWMMRRACYVRLDPKQAAVAGIAYLLMVAAGVYLLHHLNAFSLPKAMAVMSISGLAAGLWLAAKEGVTQPDAADPKIRSAAMDHWRYGRWAAATGIVGCIPGQLYYLILPHLEFSGALRAMTLLLMPVLQATSAICTLLLPQLARARGTASYGRIIRLAMLVLVGGPLVFWLALGILHEPVMRIVYGGKYIEYSHLLWILGFQPVLGSVLAVYMASLGAQERPDIVFYASLAGAIVTSTLGIYLTSTNGLLGVAWACNLATALSAAIAWAFSRSIQQPLDAEAMVPEMA